MMTIEGDLIRRFQPTSDATPPWAGMSFIQPVDSDELHEHLKSVYPQYSTLRERKHMAAIDFLKIELRELRQLQSKDPPLGVAEHSTDYHALASPESPSFSSEAVGGRSRRGSASVSHSPASSTQFSTSAEHNLQSDSPVGLVRPQSITLSTANTGQYNVFSAVDGRMLQPKTKRRMTVEEKTAYKQTRKRGACPKCKKLKGKCTHAVRMAKVYGGREEPEAIQKRRLSHEPNMDHLEQTKISKFDNASDVHHHLTLNVPPSQDTGSFIAPSVINNEAAGSSDQHNVTSNDAHWDKGSGETDDLVTEYVPHELQLDSYGMPLPNDHGSEWTTYPTPIVGHNFNSGQAGFGDTPSQFETVYPSTSSHNDLRSENFYHNNFYGNDSWTEGQDPPSQDANPG